MTHAAYRPSCAHAQLGAEFYDVVEPARFPAHVLRFRNQDWAARVGLGTLSDAEWVEHFGRFAALPGSCTEKLALRYHGHQFRHYNPELGDGRGFLFAQLYDDRGRLLDLATKGSGTTPWSRTADGRLTLKGGVREVLATAMLAALGVNTSKSFSLIETGESLYRGDEPSPTRSAVLVRLSHSHIRIGTFQRFAALQEPENTRRLLDYTIRTYMPDAWREDEAERATAFLANVIAGVARTGAQWMVAGFVHGVLNTDNINVTGESFDYGPWRFLPVFDPSFTAAYFDDRGLYAYGRQPGTLLWNLIRLAECLLVLAPQAALESALGQFKPQYDDALEQALLWRLGVVASDAAAGAALTAVWWRFLHDSQVPFEQAMFDWRGGLASEARATKSPAAAAYAGEVFGPVRAALAGVAAVPGALEHDYWTGAAPYTMLVDDVEAVWAPIAEADDWSTFHAKLAAIKMMAAAYGAGPTIDIPEL